MVDRGLLEAWLRAAMPDDLDLLVAIDDDACELFAQAGIDLSFGADSALVREERAAWAAAIAAGGVRLACGVDPAGGDGFIAMAWKDGVPFIEQVSVRRRAMGRGLGRALIAWGEDWARGQGARRVLLTTYGHLPRNRPYYEKYGWSVLPDTQRGPELRAALAFQRAHLPHPALRIAMAKTL